MGKSLSNKYSQKRLDRATKSTTDAIKTTSKKKKKKATDDLIGNKIADKITSVSKKPSNNNNNNNDVGLTTHKKRYISPEERQQIINELRLALKRWVFLKIIDEMILILKIYKLKVTIIV